MYSKSSTLSIVHDTDVVLPDREGLNFNQMLLHIARLIRSKQLGSIDGDQYQPMCVGSLWFHAGGK